MRLEVRDAPHLAEDTGRHQLASEQVNRVAPELLGHAKHDTVPHGLRCHVARLTQRIADRRFNEVMDTVRRQQTGNRVVRGRRRSHERRLHGLHFQQFRERIEAVHAEMRRRGVAIGRHRVAHGHDAHPFGEPRQYREIHALRAPAAADERHVERSRHGERFWHQRRKTESLPTLVRTKALCFLPVTTTMSLVEKTGIDFFIVPDYLAGKRALNRMGCASQIRSSTYYKFRYATTRFVIAARKTACGPRH